MEKCEFCDRPIGEGTKYHYQNSGDFQSDFSICRACFLGIPQKVNCELTLYNPFRRVQSSEKDYLVAVEMAPAGSRLEEK